MEVVISSTADEAGKLAADAIEDLLRRRSQAVLGVATGSSPLIIYEELGRRVAQGSWSLACRQIIRNAIEMSSAKSSSTRSISIPSRSWDQMG